MKRLILAAIALFAAAAHAETFRCPQIYPGNDAPRAFLTGASMRSGAMRGDGWIAPPMPEAAEEGYDLRYAFADDEQAWLVCEYGAKKRVKGRFHDGHEWNQAMSGSVADWWVKLTPNVGICTVQVRELKMRSQNKSKWFVTANCAKP